MSTKWIPDPNFYAIKSLDRQSQFTLEGGYSEWTMAIGAPFNFTEELVKVDPQDFRPSAVIGNIDGSSNPKPAPVTTEAAGKANGANHTGDNVTEDDGGSGDGSFIENFSAIIPLEAQGQAIGTKPTAQTGFITRLPIRISSIARPLATIPPYSPPASLDDKKTAIVAVIDDSIAAVNPRFQTYDPSEQRETRFDYFWVQDAKARSGLSAVTYGREVLKAEIDAVIAKDELTEDEMFRQLNLVTPMTREYLPNPLRKRISHGTHVAELAAGYSIDDADARNIRLIGVQLPMPATLDTSGSSLIAVMFDAMEYVLQRSCLMAATLGFAVPLFVNISYGFSSGPRNTKGLLEQKIDSVIRRYRKFLKAANLTGWEHPVIEFCVPAGNQHLMRCHAQTDKKGSSKRHKLETTLLLPPQDRTSSFLEVWLPQAAKKLKLTITAPGLKQYVMRYALSAPSTMPPGRDAHVLQVGGSSTPDIDKMIARVTLDVPSQSVSLVGPSHYYRVLIAFAPTRVMDSSRPAAPAGEWHISAEAKISKNERIDAWILRDTPVIGEGIRGEQAYFRDDAYEDDLFDAVGDPLVFDRADSQIRRDGTRSGLATPRKHVVTVGGFYLHNRAGTAYSAAGSDTIEGPDVMAPTETCRSLLGVPGIGMRTGSALSLNGTSVAAPQIVKMLCDTVKKKNIGPEREKFHRKFLKKFA
ncbi:MAG: hypothetical protein AAFU66_03845, partial [Pseudomonadota bacterium]